MGTVEALHEYEPLCRLLAEYCRLAAEQPECQWHDRVMELEDVPAKALVQLHGVLLASGWLETRVVADAFREPRAVLAAYRPTREGQFALRMIHTGTARHQSAETPWHE